MTDVVIIGAARTPIGGFQGALSNMTAPQLGAHAIGAALDGAHISRDDIDEVLMGCVLPAGLGQAPARQASLGAGLSINVPCTTVNKVCGSGMKTAMLAFDQIRAGSLKMVVAGGMESMSGAPYLSPNTRNGARLGHAALKDHMFLDGLEDAYNKGTLMGVFAETCADHYQFTRKEQDDYALSSLAFAVAAQESGQFTDEIAPVTLKTRNGDISVAIDEQPGNARPEKIPQLKPAFRADGTVTAANSSSISDGASAVVLASQAQAETLGLPVSAVVKGHATFAHEPEWFTTAPVHAAQKRLDQIGWTKDNVDLWEVNEAFAVVAMAFMRDLGLARDIVNVNGGAIALGHPLGCTGAKLSVQLFDEMRKRDMKGKYGMVTMCVGTGQGAAGIYEFLN